MMSIAIQILNASNWWIVLRQLSGCEPGIRDVPRPTGVTAAWPCKTFTDMGLLRKRGFDRRLEA